MNSSRGDQLGESNSTRSLSFLRRAALLGFFALSLVGQGHAQAIQPVSVVNVLVLYTTQALSGAGGTTPILNQINGALVEANTVFQNSHIKARLHLALATRINYRESGSVSNDLARLRNPGTGILGQAHRLRDQYKADLVCLVTETGDDWWFYGLQGPSADNAFSIVRRPFLTGGYYFPVALSFNFGCQLERSYADSLGAFPYAYGYSFWAGDNFYSTIDSFSGERIPFFSNPDLQYQGVAIGSPVGTVNAADNALVINQTASIVAAFRRPAPLTMPPVVSIRSPIEGARFRSGTNITLSANATDADGKVVRVEYYEGTNRLSSSGTAPFKALWRKVPVGEHSIVAVATDNLGASTISEPVHIIIAPTNDDFVARTRIFGVTNALRTSNTLATAEPGENDHAGFSPAYSLWWTYTAAADGVVTLDASASSFYASLAVYTGNSLNTLVEVTSTSGNDQNAVRFQVAAGQSYQIVLDSPYDGTGDVALNMSFSSSPANDNFAQRQRLNGNHLRVRANNRGATREVGEPNHAETPGIASLWWSWTAPADGALTLSPISQVGASLLLGVYSGSAITSLVTVPTQFEYPASFVAMVQKGVNYQIAVDNPNDPFQPGPFTLGLDFIAGPSNDDFAGRSTIQGARIVLTNSTLLATRELGEPDYYGTGWPSVWWSWTAPVTGRVTLTSPSFAYTYGYFGVYQGTAVTNLTEVTGGGSATFDAVAGATYAIAGVGPPGELILDLIMSTVRITSPTNGVQLALGSKILLTASTTPADGIVRQIEYLANGNPIGVATHAPFAVMWTNQAAGDFVFEAVATDALNLTRMSPPLSATFFWPAPSNDDFANRTILNGSWILVTNWDFSATVEPGEPSHPSNSSWGWNNTIWWSWTAPNSGHVAISTSSSHLLAVYTGNSLSNLTEVATSYGGGFEAVSGMTYQIADAGWPGQVVLNLVLSNLRIVSPLDGADFVTGSDIDILASTTSTEGVVRQVEFFENDISIGTATNSPFGLSWTNVSGGSYSLYAVATDDQGHSRTSRAISVTVKPPNDNFNNAITLWGGRVHTNGSMVGATMESGEPRHDGPGGGRSVWYTWSAPDSARYSVIADSFWRFAAMLAVYTGTNLSHLTLVASNANWRSTIFSAQAGTTYLIAVDSTAGSVEGDFSLDILKPPPNDNFAARLTIPNANSLVTGTNLGASWEPGEQLVPGWGGQSLWWSWIAPKSGRISFTTQRAPMLHIYTGSTVSSLTLLPGQYGGLWDEIDSLTFDVTAVTQYMISADEKWNNDWSVAFTLNFTPRPDNDDFSNSLELTGTNLTIGGENIVATREVGESNHAGSSAGHSVWFAWKAPMRGLVTVSATGTNFTPVFEVYTGTNVAALTGVGTRNANGVSFNATADTSYHIAVDGGGGYFNLNLSLVAPPFNDDFEERFSLGGLNPSVRGTTYLAGRQSGEPSFSPWVVDRSVWYSWVAPADGTVRVHCPNRPAAVYSGNSVSNLIVLAPVNPGYFTDLVFTATSGTEYEIAVGGAWWLPDDFTLSLMMPKAQIASPTNGAAFPPPANFEIVARTIDIDGAVVSVSFFDGTNLLGTVTNAPFQMDYLNVPAGSHQLSVKSVDENGLATASETVEVKVKPDNDDFAQRISVNGTSAIIVGDTSGATSEAGEVPPGGASGRTLWWNWTAPSNGVVTIGTSAFSAGMLSTASLPIASRSVHRESVIITGPGFPNPPGPTTGPLINVYTGTSVANLNPYASNAVWFTSIILLTGEWCVLPSFSFPVVGGQTYQLSLDGINGSFGSASVTLNFAPPPIPPSPPVNDNFAQAALLSNSSVSIVGTTTAATREAGEPSHEAAFESGTVWYSWTAAASGNAQVEVSIGDSSDLAVAVYAGASIWSLTPVVLGGQDVSFYALAGITYKFAVSGSAASKVDFALTLNGPTPPPQIDFDHTKRLSNDNYNVRVTGVTGQSFVVQVSSDSQNWATLRVDTLLASYLDFVDTATTPRQRYYRVQPFDAAFNYRPFTLLAPNLQAGIGFSLHLSGLAGQPFRLQSSTNFLDWSDLTGGILSNDQFDFTDQDAPKFNARFYRALKQ